MTKIVCSAQKFLDMIRMGLVNNHFDAMEVSFTPTLITTTTSRAGTFGSWNTFKPTYFKEYSCVAPETIKLTKALHSNLMTLKFAGDDQITIDVDLANSRLTISGPRSNYAPVLTNPDVQPLKITLTEKPTIGLLPASETRPVHYQIRVPARSLATPKMEKNAKVTYKVNGKDLILDLNLGGVYNEQITPLEVLKPREAATGEKTSYTFFVDHLADILANFSENVVVTIYERGIFITQMNEAYSLMYMTAIV